MRGFLLVGLVGCDLGKTEVSGYDLMHTECGPTDGPVPELKIDLDGEDCDADTPAATPWVRVRFSEGTPSTGVPYEPAAGDLSVWIYPDGGETWESAAGGSLTLDTYTAGVEAGGSYSFTLEDGSTLEGDFDASFCELDYGPCG